MNYEADNEETIVLYQSWPRNITKKATEQVDDKKQQQPFPSRRVAVMSYPKWASKGNALTKIGSRTH